jgi:hypothetical protein
MVGNVFAIPSSGAANEAKHNSDNINALFMESGLVVA